MPEDILKIPEPYPTKLYCWGGGGGGGTLGIQNGALRKISLIPCQIDLPTSSPVVSISAGHHRTIGTTHSKECYSWGKPPLGRRTSSMTSEAMPKKIKGIQGCVKKISHGETHSMILTTDGSIFAFGDASDGKLGLRHKTRGQVILPTLVETKKKYIDVACGYASTTLILDCGKGGVTFGTTGSDERSRNVRKKSGTPFCSFSFPVKFISISSGTSHLAAVSSNGHCYTWGLNCNGRLGHGNEKGYQADTIEANPKRVEYFVEKSIIISKAFCGGAHTCVLGEEGRIFSFGWNIYFQCGVGSSSPNEKDNCDVSVPTEVCMEGRYIVDLSCGFAHSLAIDITGNLWGWGFNEEGQLGLGHEQNMKDPAHIEFHGEAEEEYAVAVSAGKTHTVCVTSSCAMPEFFHRIDEIATKQNAIATLRRFFGNLFFKLKLQRLQRLEKCNLNETGDDIAESCSNEDASKQETAIDDSTNMSSDSWSSEEVNDSDIHLSGNPPAIENGSLSFRRQIEELHSMTLEDERSRQLMRIQQIYTNEVKKKKIRVVHEIIRRYESFCMTKEDQSSFALREVERKKIQQQMEIIKKEKISRRDAKAKEQIMKEADRMLKAKIKEKPKMQPKKRRKQSIVKGTWSREKIKENNDSFDEFYPITFNSEYHKKLLLRRRRRILHQEQSIQEERERQREIDEYNIKMKDMIMKKSKQQISDLVAKMDTLLIRRREKTTSKLREMKNSLPRIEVKDNADWNLHTPSSALRSVAEWSRELC